MDIILAIISAITAIIVTWMKNQQSKDSPKIQTISDKLYQFKEKTNEKLDSLGKDFKDVRNEVEGMSRSMSSLKREIQDIHISRAKINPEEVKKNFGKVILLEEKTKVFEKLHLKTAQEIGKIKKTMDGD